jgi:hypothetical protein
LSSAIRLFVLDHYRSQLNEPKGERNTTREILAARGPSPVLRAD